MSFSEDLTCQGPRIRQQVSDADSSSCHHWSQSGSTFSGINRVGGNLNQVGNIHTATFHQAPATNRRKAFFDWLRAIDFEQDHEYIFGKRYKQTGDWILRREEFQHWYQSSSSQLLWCWGAPGAGKSVLASIALDYLRTNLASDRKVGLAFAYFKYDVPEHQNPSRIFQSFIGQLCYALEDIPDHLLQFYEEFDINSRFPSNSRYITELQALAKRYQEVFIVIDALDECNVQHRGDFIETLSKLTATLPCIKILITSRRESDIENAFTTQRTPIIPIEARDVGKDINDFIRGRVEEWVGNKKLYIKSEELKREVISKLVDGANGMFLWVDLQLNILCKYRRDRDIKEALDILPRGLDKTYQRIIDQIEKQEPQLQLLAQKILTWVFYASRPLTIEELIDAVAIDDTCLTRQHLDSNAYPEEVIFEACANLLSREMSRVRPIHYSVQEFFTKLPTNNSSRILTYTTNRNLAYTHLANCCIRYLMLNSLADTSCFDDTYLIIRLVQNPLAAHSAYTFDQYFVQLDDVSPDLQENLQLLLSSSKQSLASILQLRRLRDNSHTDNIIATFNRFEDNISPEDIIYATTLFNSAQLLSINNRWKDITAPQYALHRAAGAGIVDAIPLLVKSGQDVQGEDMYKITPLYYACEGGYIEMCRLLINFRANVNAQGGHFGNSLQAATSGGHETIARLLLKYGADVNTQGGHFGNSLQAATSGGHETIARLLLKYSADVNAQGGHFGNALYATSYKGYETIARLLLEHGADVNTQGGHFGNALQATSYEGYETIARQLLKHGADVNAQGGHFGNSLQAASFGGHKAVVRLLLEHGADVNAQGGHFGNALQAASSRGHKAVVRLLLEHGADVNAQGGMFSNALQAATSRGHKAVIRLLLEHGADVNAQGGHFGNALQAASSEGHEAVVRLLLEHGADIKA